MLNVDFDLRRNLSELSQQNLRLCYQCSSCSGVCPWNDFREFDPRSIIHHGQLGVWDIQKEETWLCTTCGRCHLLCPHDVKIADIMMGIRRIAIDDGRGVPEEITATLVSLLRQGNPWNAKRKNRVQWAEERGLNIKILPEESAEILYFVGCTASYDPRGQKIAEALTKIFTAAEVDFGILGKNETDCGCCTRFVGETDLAEMNKEKNVKAILEAGVSTIVTTSPHSSYIKQTTYDLPSNIEVLHYTEFLARLIREKRLKFYNNEKSKVTFHDPCYLANHSGITEIPREILCAIPNLELVEMPHNRQRSLCCGGGGGGVWRETKPEYRFSLTRTKEAAGTEANTLATACYYCVLMFEDAIKLLGMSDTIQVKEIAELVADAIKE